MKQIFLLGAVLSSGYIYAQQIDGFDIQKYLENKKKKEMTGELTDPHLRYYSPPASGNYPPCGKYYKDFYKLRNGNKVHFLPQDNMPCVVPDMSQFNMPVVKPSLSPYTIPIPAYPPQSKIVPGKTERLKEILELLNKGQNK